jgi:hypothetical protein
MRHRSIPRLPISASCICRARPHGGLQLAVPQPVTTLGPVPENGRIQRRDVLGGLIHEYQLAA